MFFWGHWFPPKHKRTNSTLLLWYLKSTCLHSFFGENWRHQKNHFEIKRPLVETCMTGFLGISTWTQSFLHSLDARCDAFTLDAGVLFWSIISYSLHSFYYPPTLCYLLSAKVIYDKYSKYWHYILAHTKVKLVLLQYFKSWFEFVFFHFLISFISWAEQFHSNVYSTWDIHI